MPWRIPQITVQISKLQNANNALQLGLNNYRLEKLYRSGQIVDMNQSILKNINNIPYSVRHNLPIVKEVINSNRGRLSKLYIDIKHQRFITPVLIETKSGRYYIVSGKLNMFMYLANDIPIKVVVLKNYQAIESSPFQL